MGAQKALLISTHLIVRKKQLLKLKGEREIQPAQAGEPLFRAGMRASLFLELFVHFCLLRLR